MAASTSLGLSQVSSVQRRTLTAAALGWVLDAFDASALRAGAGAPDARSWHEQGDCRSTLHTDPPGLWNGWGLFGFIADRVGRKRALMLGILTYSICSFASGLATSVLMLAVFRFILGLGMGSEWNTGATLVAETWPTELRAKAISVVQSSWAIGYALAALVASVVLHYADWRVVFFVGILPALLILWIQESVPESEMWREHHQLALESRRVAEAQEKYRHDSFLRLFQPPYVKSTFALLFATFLGMFGWWGLFTWITPYLALPVSQAGVA